MLWPHSLKSGNWKHWEKKKVAQVVSYCNQAGSLKQRNISRGGSLALLYLAVGLAMCLLRQPSLNWSPLWGGCLGNQSWSLGLVLQKKKRKTKQNTIRAYTTTTPSSDPFVSLLHKQLFCMFQRHKACLLRSLLPAHISTGSCMYEIKFFSCSSALCQLNH